MWKIFIKVSEELFYTTVYLVEKAFWMISSMRWMDLTLG